MQTVLARYFETLRLTLRKYLEAADATAQKALLDSVDFYELDEIHFKYIQPIFRRLVSLLKQTMNDDYQQRVDRRLAVFIVFFIILCTAFLVIWTPFVNKLNKEVSKARVGS